MSFENFFAQQLGGVNKVIALRVRAVGLLRVVYPQCEASESYTSCCCVGLGAPVKNQPIFARR